MPVKVVDVSALAAILFDEPEQRHVAEQIRRVDLIAPTLISYELASVCLKKLRRYPQQRDALVASLALAERMGIQQVKVDPIETTVLADEAGVTAYDAAYLWLALAHGVPLVTLDQKLGRVAASLASSGTLPK